MKPPFSDQDFESIRKKAYALRHNYLDDMEKHLLNLEAALQQKGLNVLWIKDRNSLAETIASLVGNYNARRISFDTRIQLGRILCRLKQLKTLPMILICWL